MGDDRHALFHGCQCLLRLHRVLGLTRIGGDHPQRTLGREPGHNRPLESPGLAHNKPPVIEPFVISWAPAVGQEASIGAVGIEPVDQGIAIAPVVRLGRRDPIQIALAFAQRHNGINARTRGELLYGR